MIHALVKSLMYFEAYCAVYYAICCAVYFPIYYAIRCYYAMIYIMGAKRLSKAHYCACANDLSTVKSFAKLENSINLNSRWSFFKNYVSTKLKETEKQYLWKA